MLVALLSYIIVECICRISSYVMASIATIIRDPSNPLMCFIKHMSGLHLLCIIAIIVKNKTGKTTNNKMYARRTRILFQIKNSIQ